DIILEPKSEIIKETYTNRVIYEDKKSQDLPIEQIKRKTETRVKIEVWVSENKENLELEFDKAKKRRKKVWREIIE
ncbi:12342_t:CDS:2, partial [Gigaspora rosea]